MIFVTANNDREQLESLTKLLLAAFPGSVIYQHADPMLAPKSVQDNKVDAVFAEARMKRVDGLELLHILRKKKPDVPVFVLSETEEYRDEAIKQGADAYLLHPVTVQSLRSALLAVKAV